MTGMGSLRFYVIMNYELLRFAQSIIYLDLDNEN